MTAVRVKRLLALLIAPMAALTASITPMAAEAAPASPQFYLSLGDSLAQGVQPNATGQSVETNQGYADQLFQIEQSQFTNLQLAKLGCPGETSTSFLTGVPPFCAYSPTPQMQEALAFLAAHHGHVAFITIDIGGNDVDNCLQGTAINMTCINAGLTAIAPNLSAILTQLKAAAPGVPIIGMNLYDPFLALYLQGQQGLALSSEQLSVILNNEFAQVYGAFGVPVADVAGAFLTTNMTLIAGVPLDVQEICLLTWMCVPPPVGPNIHANALGYGVIALQFAQQIITKATMASLVSTTASGAVTVGGTINDAATLSGGVGPTGTITFQLFGPDNATCAGTPAFTSTRTVTGNGAYTSDSFSTSASGTYRWVAAYSGDANNNDVVTGCSDPAESVVVNAAAVSPAVVPTLPRSGSGSATGAGHRGALVLLLLLALPATILTMALARRRSGGRGAA
jgi:lysophospholipase L1-like esterase